MNPPRAPRLQEFPPPPPRAPAPRATSSEVALTGPEFQPVYANLIREVSALPPPQQGGDQGWSP